MRTVREAQVMVVAPMHINNCHGADCEINMKDC